MNNPSITSELSKHSKMKEKNQVVIIYVYNSFDDPLFKGVLLPFMKHVSSKRTDLFFYLITYEQVEWPLTVKQRQQISAELMHYNITWYPLKWHSGNFKLIKKLYDLVLGAFLVTKLKIRNNAREIAALGTIAGSFAFVMAKMLRLRYYGFTYEPHSEFMRDFKLWPTSGLAYKGLHYFEKLSGHYADVLATGTVHMMNRLEESGSKAQLFKLPSCVDETLIRFQPDGRKRIRHELGLSEDQPVILYLGKFGGIYYDKEIAVLFSALLNQQSDLHFLIVSPNSVSHISSLMQAEGLPNSQFTITRSPYEQVQDYISAADFGIVAIPSLPSQRFRSPIKVGEYLCCGLPYLVCSGVSEDDIIADKYQVGVVISSFTNTEVQRVFPQIQNFLTMDKIILRERCRTAGVIYRGLSQYLPTVEDIFAKT